MTTIHAPQGVYTGPSDQEVVSVLQRMASARAQLMQAERLSDRSGGAPAPTLRVDAIEEAHADVLWAQAELLTSTKKLRRTKAVDAAAAHERAMLLRHGYSSFGDYLKARTGPPTRDVHLTIARREYEDAQETWDRLQAEIDAAEPTLIIDLTGDEPRAIF
jgi:hypothetical protein